MKIVSVKTSIVTFGAFALFALASTGAHAGDAAKEAQVAADHAGYAAGASTWDDAKSHLHHAVNCLVGANNEMFDSSELDPCDGMGNGAIPDAKDADMKAKLDMALRAALAGLDAEDLQIAKANAKEAAEILKGVH